MKLRVAVYAIIFVRALLTPEVLARSKIRRSIQPWQVECWHELSKPHETELTYEEKFNSFMMFALVYGKATGRWSDPRDSY